MRSGLLIVEDDPIIAVDLSERLADAGYTVAGVATTLAEGLRLCDACALALLDANLGFGETSEPIAERMRAAGAPFLVLTGYAQGQLPQTLAEAPLFGKPVDFRALIDALNAVIDETGANF